MKLNKKLSKGKVSVVVGTQKEESDYMVSSKDINRNQNDLEAKIDEILKELKEELREELGLKSDAQKVAKASTPKGLDDFIYQSLSKSF